MRILCHVQHLSGVGHYVRMHRIAAGLARAHEVHIVDGGRPVPHLCNATAWEGEAPAEPHRGGMARREPRPPNAVQMQRVCLPPIARAGTELVALGTGTTIGSAMRERARILAEAVEHIRPDVLLIEHYPFSKWELEGEITAAIDAARRVHPTVRVLCSLRDIVRQTRYEPVEPAAYGERVLATVHGHFDGILVHADPSFTRLEAHFAGAPRLRVPVAYTGFVAPASAADATECVPPYAVLSCGGGAQALAFVLAAMEAFGRLAADGVLGPLELVVFPGAFASAADLAAIEAVARGGPFRIERFGAGFEDALQDAVLSISRAGYNTCAALLHARVRAVLAPDPLMSDQAVRAHRLATLGLATLAVDGPPVEALMTAMQSALASPPPRHGLDLDGVERSRILIETLDAWCPERGRGGGAVAADRSGSAGPTE